MLARPMAVEHADRDDPRGAGRASQRPQAAAREAPSPTPSAPLDAGNVLAMQRSAGNAAVSSLIARQPLPPPAPPVNAAGLLGKARGGDKPGFFQDIRGLAGSSAGDAGLRGAIDTLRGDGTLTPAESLRAVLLLELGSEQTWPREVTNFARGVDGGQFTIGAGPLPSGSDDLRELCVERAGAAASGGLNAPAAAAAPPAQVARDYRTRFDARWNLARFSGFAIEFDDTLPSKGPRNRRAHEIFGELYLGEPALQNAYDHNLGGVRELCDTYTHPEGANAIASPRVETLRKLFDGAPFVANGIGHAAYTAFMATVVPAAQPLDAGDRAYIENSRAWRGIIERKVHGTNDAVTQALFDNTKATILGAQPPAPAGGAAPAAPAAPAPAGPVAVPNAAQAAFLGGITFTGPVSPITADTATQKLDYQVRSAVPNPGLNVRRHVIVDPGQKVKAGQDDEKAWAPAAAAADHSAEVEVDAGAAPHTDYTARLRMEGIPAGAFAEKNVATRVIDHRRAFFIANIDAGLLFTQENDFLRWAPGTAMNYFGGQMPIEVQPHLPADNPGLQIFMRGRLKRGAATIANYPLVPFGQGKEKLLGSTIIRPPVPAPAGPDHLELTIDFFPSAAIVGAPMHTIVQPFTIDPALPVAAGADAALIAADNAELNLPRGTAGSLRNHLSTFAAGTNEARMLAAIEAGSLIVEATIVRSDSAKWLLGPPVRGNPATQVAYAIGAVSNARTLVGQANAIGWHWDAFHDHVFLNLTPDSHNPGAKRTPPDVAPFLMHEGIHALDQTPAATDVFGRYQQEFRAYWVQNDPDIGGGLSTEFDAGLPVKIGPRSARSNAIFMHMYDSATYDYVRPAYDSNAGGFRDRVDAYLYPDGINLLLSAHLADLRKEVETYNGTAAAFAAKRAAITAALGLCDASERQEIEGNRVWRNLVETKFTGTAVPVGGGAPTPRADQIKDILGIAR
jgi:hypothetical protein